jgi:hypothetical protein
MCDNSLKIKIPLKEISAVYLHCIAGGGNKDNDASFAQSTPPTTNSGAFNFPPTPSPISGYIVGNEDGAKLDLKYDVNKNFAISGSATTDYNKVVNKGIFIEFSHVF